MTATLVTESNLDDVPEGKGLLSILDESGDVRQIWDSTNADEVAHARQTFKDFKAKGYTAYKVNKKGEKGEIINEFDPEAEKIIMAPTTVGG